ncbi:FAD-binding and (Fe-S)-binding domain-containing protein [Mangrovibacterium diazotrophicum]|uniref:Fe-S oxidoreductase n=1 Tax=Mangrovibacterium diazotrophicum TaxID=1261403 RepID=A0A419VU92_9BACT|nr:FAD-binding and (Fe-S)-binding domain-containing protein [Mangrovibacterium diazotrophicum]RKD85032.1 Fe-S oxidoreductase [Mangrovibacterium diazotrophicum]
MSQIETYDILKEKLTGDLFTENVQRVLYATDASSYREIPQAVCKPKTADDIRAIIKFAADKGTSVIPRAAGTSLAGQVVGPGIVVDISKYMNKILEFNPTEQWVWVEPGVNLAELNQFLAPHGLQFGPETSTANRCCIGGMVGNNSCGLHSLVYGSARDHLLEADCILSDGSSVTFKALSNKEFEAKCEGDPALLETRIYQNIFETLSTKHNQEQIRKEFPDPKVKRRNNGYAIDVLLETDPFTGNGEQINVCKLLAGSEGTLAFSTRLKLNLIPLPPSHRGLVCAHFSSLKEAYHGNLIALKHGPTAIELMDEIIMNCTKENIEQRKNRFFVSGDPAAMLMIEFACETLEELLQKAADLEADYRIAGLGYHFPLVQGDDNIKKVWALRTAGLGLLSNIPGDKRSVTVIEDTAVAPEYLPDYMEEFDQILAKYGLSCVKYAHIATGEIHLRPLLNLKDDADVDLYHTIAKEIAALVKKFKGSLSGEHGDGRLRGEFIPFMLGEHNYRLIKKLKKTWDPQNILNPGKIVDTPPITENLRYLVGKQPEFKTTFDFASNEGLLRAVEMCNGSADCRKSVLIGGTMCPTFMATKDEDKSTRGRANVLREFLSRSGKANRFDHEEIYQVMDLCISCKACKAECPSNVDMAKLKAEFLQHYYQEHGIPMRTKLIAYLPRLYRIGRPFRPITNKISNAAWFKKAIGFAPEREVPQLSKLTLRKWYRKPAELNGNVLGKVYLFADEFTNENESDIGVKAILLLNKLGYEVVIPKHRESGRTFLSKGLLKTAKEIARENIEMLTDLISAKTPLIGIEPSALLTFRDEYPDLLEGELKTKAQELAKNTLLIDEFLAGQHEKGKINKHLFTLDKVGIKLHGHCQQKAVASTGPTRKMLEIPSNYKVTEIQTSCCGMAGSFGYEKEHYELSMKIGEMKLFPAVREASAKELIAAPGTSCRHHIKHGTGREALHPVEILYNALK